MINHLTKGLMPAAYLQALALALVLPLAGCAGRERPLSDVAPTKSAAAGENPIDAIETDVPSLKEVFQNDFSIGCILSYPHIGFADDPPVEGQGRVLAPNGGNLVRYHMNSLSPGNNMKAENTVDLNASAATYGAAATPEEQAFANTHPVVRFNGNMIAQLNWARRQGMAFRGHTLVWHNQTPAGFFRNGYAVDGTLLPKEAMAERMKNYIYEVVRLLHEGWPGMLVAMDVVNEAVYDNGTFRAMNNLWYAVFGDESYVGLAFRFAHEAKSLYGEEQMMLYYNDYNTQIAAKADGIVRLLAPIWAAGDLDGIGMQHHDSLYNPTAANFAAAYDKFFPICIEMSITELDVDPESSTPPNEKTLKLQAEQYAELFAVFVARSARSGRGKIVNVTKDGLNDRWAFKRYASLWDDNNKAKPAFWSVVATAGTVAAGSASVK